MNTVFAVILGLLACAHTTCEASELPQYQYRLVSSFNVEHPAFMSVLPWRADEKQENARDALYISQFGASSPGQISVFDDIAALPSAPPTKKPAQFGKFEWPNTMTSIPSSVFGMDDAVLVADGFLVPGRVTGGLYVVAKGGSFITPIAARDFGHFYHFGQWVDLNGDGHLDLISARAHNIGGTFLPKFVGELVWFENPNASIESLANGEFWNEHVIGQGPDILFQVVHLTGLNNTVEVVASEFFGQRLSLWSLSTEDGSLLWQRTIDDTIGKAYSVSLVDLDADGVDELLVNNHEHMASKSAVYAYEIPANIENDEFPRHTLASGFQTVRWYNPTEASPGFPYAFTPRVGAIEEKKHILIAGDGAHAAYLLRPTAKDWEYTMEVAQNVGDTVGSVLVHDLDNDGYNEFLVPNYEKGIVSVFTFAPADLPSSLMQIQ